MHFFEHYPDYEYGLAATQLVLAMLGMGATMSVGDFARVFKTPKGLALGMLLQVVVVPLIAFALGRVTGVAAGVAAGLILVSAVPGGALSNIYTYLGRGHAALSISLTTVATLGCLVTTPAVMLLLASEHLASDFEMPVGRIVFEIAVCLLLPLGVGMVVGHRLPDIKNPFSKWCIRGSLFFIGLLVVGSLGSGRIELGAYGWSVPLVIIVLTIVSQAVSMGVGRLFGLGSPQRLALAIEVTIRNANLAVLLKASLFPVEAGVADPIADGVLFVALFYGGASLLIALPATIRHRRRVAAEAT